MKLRIGVMACLTLTLAVGVATATSAQPSVVGDPIYGADASFGNCPQSGVPPAGTVCVETEVLFWKGVRVEGGGSVAPPQAPWQVYAETHRLEFDGSGGDPDVTILRWGFELLDGGVSA